MIWDKYKNYMVPYKKENPLKEIRAQGHSEIILTKTTDESFDDDEMDSHQIALKMRKSAIQKRN